MFKKANKINKSIATTKKSKPNTTKTEYACGVCGKPVVHEDRYCHNCGFQW